MLEDSEETREIYPHAFKVVYTVTLHGDHLCTEFRVVNTGDAVLSFTGALHGYFEVAHVSKARVTGLQGLKTLNKVPDPNNPTEGVMEDEVLTFPGHVDCVFLDAKDYVELDVGTGAAIAVSPRRRYRSPVNVCVRADVIEDVERCRLLESLYDHARLL